MLCAAARKIRDQITKTLNIKLSSLQKKPSETSEKVFSKESIKTSLNFLSVKSTKLLIKKELNQNKVKPSNIIEAAYL